MPDARTKLLITCEHAAPGVPPECRGMIPASVLRTHRGFDAGAMDLALILAARARSPLHLYCTSRLVVDQNRSPDRPEVFSRYTRDLPEAQRQRLLKDHHAPFRAAVARDLRSWLGSSKSNTRKPRVAHISVHSFTPVLRGVRRGVDVGFLFDPARAFESRFVTQWMRELRRLEPRLVLRRNEPYRGTDDGHTTHLRTIFPDRQYAGIELELNQRLVRGSPPRRARIYANLAESLISAWESLP